MSRDGVGVVCGVQTRCGGSVQRGNMFGGSVRCGDMVGGGVQCGDMLCGQCAVWTHAVGVVCSVETCVTRVIHGLTACVLT